MRAFALAVVMVSLMPALSWAEVGEGSTELGLSISSQRFEVEGEAASHDMTLVNLLYGYYITDRAELGFAVNIIEDEAGSSKTTRTGFELMGRYHFADSSKILVPYLGAQAGAVNYDDGVAESSGNSLGLMAGAKYFLGDRASVNFEYNYRSVSLEDDADNEYDATLTTISVGYSVYF
jgi:opacity protein-like surface antigen